MQYDVFPRCTLFLFNLIFDANYFSIFFKKQKIANRTNFVQLIRQLTNSLYADMITRIQGLYR